MFSYFPNATRSRAQRDYPNVANNTYIANGDRAYPQLPSGLSYSNLGAFGWTSFDDGYFQYAQPIGFTWGFLGPNYTEWFVSTNGHINFGSGSGSWNGTSNGIMGHFGDLWLEPTLNMTAQAAYQSNPNEAYFGVGSIQDYHDVWYKSYSFTQNSQVHNVLRIVAYCGRYGSDLLTRAQCGWRINLYKTNQHQFIEACLLDSTTFAANSTNPNASTGTQGIGPYNTSGVGAATLVSNTANPQVWYSPNNGDTWVYKGQGVVQTTAPAYYAYPGANLKLVPVAQAQAYVSKQFANGTAQNYITDLSVNSETATVMLRIAVGLGPRNTAESFLMDVLNSTSYAGYTNGGLKLGKIAGGNGEINSGDAVQVLKKAVGQTIDATYEQRISTLLLAVAAKIVERPEAVSMYEFGYVNGPSRRLSSLYNLTYPGSSSDTTINAPTTLSDISIGRYSGIPGTQGVLYATSGETTTISQETDKQVVFDTGYTYTVGKATGSMVRLYWTNRFELDNPSIRTEWYVQWNSRNSTAGTNSSDLTGDFYVYWNGINLNVPTGGAPIQAYPGGPIKWPNATSWTTGISTYQRGNLSRSSGPDKYGIIKQQYTVTRTDQFSTY
jgi:hypothetical protein